jgi:hypothetical protein
MSKQLKLLAYISMEQLYVKNTQSRSGFMCHPAAWGPLLLMMVQWQQEEEIKVHGQKMEGLGRNQA